MTKLKNKAKIPRKMSKYPSYHCLSKFSNRYVTVLWSLSKPIFICLQNPCVSPSKARRCQTKKATNTYFKPSVAKYCKNTLKLLSESLRTKWWSESSYNCSVFSLNNDNSVEEYDNEPCLPTFHSHLPFFCIQLKAIPILSKTSTDSSQVLHSCLVRS